MYKINFLFIALYAMLFVSFSACKKSDNGAQQQEDLYKKSPSSAIPATLKGGIWFWGNLGPIAYYDRDGHQVGNGTEAAREYEFKEVSGQGRIEFMQYLGLRNASNCVTEIYTSLKGTVVFEGADKFTFYPVEGNFKTVKTGCSDAGTTTRKATANDLKPDTYLWEVKTTSGNPLLYVYKTTDVNKQDPVFVYRFTR